MDKKIIKLDNSKLNKLINHANNLVKLLYFLFVSAILLAAVVLIKESKIFLFIIDVFKVLSPVFIGFIIAWLLKPLVEKLKEKNISNLASSFIVYISLIMVIFIFFKIFIPVIYKEINDLIKNFPHILKEFSKLLDYFVRKFSSSGIDLSNIKLNILSSITDYINAFSSKMPDNILNFTKSFLSIAGVLFTGLVVGLYMLIDFDRVHNAVINIIPNKYCKDCSNLLDKIGIEIRKTVNGTLLVALMVLVCDSLLFMIIGLDSPLLFGTICGLTDLIPYIGPYIGGLIAVVVGFSESSTVGIGVLISCFIVQIIENNILQPIVMSKTTKLHPVLIICGLLLFGHFFGITGMIFATPALTLIKCIYEYVKDKYLS